jgi:hypothetical protein
MHSELLWYYKIYNMCYIQYIEKTVSHGDRGISPTRQGHHGATDFWLLCRHHTASTLSDALAIHSCHTTQLSLQQEEVRVSPLVSPQSPPRPRFFIRTAKNGPVRSPVPRFDPDLSLFSSGLPMPSPAPRGALGDSG